MNEKDYQRFSGLKSAQKHDELPQVIADATRQLTRIADKLDERWDFNKEADDLATEVNAQLERDQDTFIEIPDDKGNVHHFHRHDLESYCDGHFNYNPRGGFYTPLSANEIKAIVDKPTSPDALVEAVEEFIKENAINGGVIALHKSDGRETIDVSIGQTEKLQSALAAHKKVVTK